MADCLEDWIRMPASDHDLRARVDALASRGQAHHEEGTPNAGVPQLDALGLLRFGGAWTALPPLEARMTQALLDRFGSVVGREAMAKAGWPERPPARNALDVHVLRLRRRLAPLGLVIRTVRSRGYLLEASGG